MVFIYYFIRAFAIGIVITINITTDIAMNNEFHFKEFFMVICSGPKKSGDGTAADGVHPAIDAARPMITANAAIL